MLAELEKLDESIELKFSRREVAVPAELRKKLEDELKRLQDRGPKRPMTMTVLEEKDIGDTRVHVRGRLYTEVGHADAKLRYRSPAVAASVTATADGFDLDLAEPAFAVARGQTAVLYVDDRVVGAGTITSASRN